MRDEYAKEICKIGQGEECCAFLLMGAKGFECAKGTFTQNAINLRLAEGTMNAKGDNCPGHPVTATADELTDE